MTDKVPGSRLLRILVAGGWRIHGTRLTAEPGGNSTKSTTPVLVATVAAATAAVTGAMVVAGTVVLAESFNLVAVMAGRVAARKSQAGEAGTSRQTRKS